MNNGHTTVSSPNKIGTSKARSTCSNTNFKKKKKEKIYFRELEQVSLRFSYVYIETVENK